MLPPQRVSYGRTRRRRSHHALSPINLCTCPLTGLPKQSHRVCKESGYVRAGLQIKVPKLGIGVPKD
ncbi:50S ribosomal protein L32 [Phycisphaerales bacterium]|nr:50S ribosomal protein L32 [Phycisphaerales bacterium]